MKEAEKILEAWKPTRITFGEGSIRRVGEIVKKYSNKVLVIVGQGSIKKSGVLDEVTGAPGKQRSPVSGLRRR